MNQQKVNAPALEIKAAIEELVHAYVECIDNDKLEQWPDFFTEECLYKVISRENYARNLLTCVIYCDSKGMLKDRITAHRHANIYEAHTYKHLVSGIRMAGQEGDTYLVRANYAVFQTRQDGITEVYNVGQYMDKITFVNGEAKFKEKLAVYDTALIPTLLVTPI
ncbi:aromatic-ring-hydroxylating dioxygenase subunit beta [Paenibacillus naphthalenovorans]|uniref:aromatic-ring-hydroxylating dioxygenase subunit beta n=1 Tax=Paenibacillus naphthalenovorans TaxID=162209 RepID=UPI00087EF2D7|nr:aromatic-ring-hydroxylating dioxygenase subunit beta [Paenibacillus naphthalenovorans]SDI83650.1 anthranilate 1,2-dioxygenase small subunit [Paenibacillus naphthalenovorans]